MYEVTFLPVLAAGVAAVLIGWVWYNPRVFGSAWMRMAGISQEAMTQGRKRMPLAALAALVTLLAAMIAAYVMNYFGIAWGVFDWIGALELAFWCWVGFVAPAMLGTVLWEGKPIRYFAITAGYWLVTLAVMSLILLF